MTIWPKLFKGFHLKTESSKLPINQIKPRPLKSNASYTRFGHNSEQLGGFYLLECKDLDEATQWAAKIPTARYGTIEVRPVVAFDQGD